MSIYSWIYFFGLFFSFSLSGWHLIFLHPIFAAFRSYFPLFSCDSITRFVGRSLCRSVGNIVQFIPFIWHTGITAPAQSHSTVHHARHEPSISFFHPSVNMNYRGDLCDWFIFCSFVFQYFSPPLFQPSNIVGEWLLSQSDGANQCWLFSTKFQMFQTFFAAMICSRQNIITLERTPV